MCVYILYCKFYIYVYIYSIVYNTEYKIQNTLVCSDLQYKKEHQGRLSRQGRKQYLGVIPEVKVVGLIHIPEIQCRVKHLRLSAKTSELP